MHQIVSIRLEYLDQLHEIVRLTKRLVAGDQTAVPLLKTHLTEFEPLSKLPITWISSPVKSPINSEGKTPARPDLDEIEKKQK